MARRLCRDPVPRGAGCLVRKCVVAPTPGWSGDSFVDVAGAHSAHDCVVLGECCPGATDAARAAKSPVEPPGPAAATAGARGLCTLGCRHGWKGVRSGGKQSHRCPESLGAVGRGGGGPKGTAGPGMTVGTLVAAGAPAVSVPFRGRTVCPWARAPRWSREGRQAGGRRCRRWC